MVDLIGKCPCDTINKNGEKLRVAIEVTFKWISDNFNTCHEDADEDVIKKLALVQALYPCHRQPWLHPQD
jgi:hypothetical protein